MQICTDFYNHIFIPIYFTDSISVFLLQDIIGRDTSCGRVCQVHTDFFLQSMMNKIQKINCNY